MYKDFTIYHDADAETTYQASYIMRMVDWWNRSIVAVWRRGKRGLRHPGFWNV